jgi:hypothetical protein
MHSLYIHGILHLKFLFQYCFIFDNIIERNILRETCNYIKDDDIVLIVDRRVKKVKRSIF